MISCQELGPVEYGDDHPNGQVAFVSETVIEADERNPFKFPAMTDAEGNLILLPDGFGSCTK